MAALQADPISHVVEELDRRDDPALKKVLSSVYVQASPLANIDIASCIYKEERSKRHLRHRGEAAGALAERQLVGPRASLRAPCG